MAIRISLAILFTLLLAPFAVGALVNVADPEDVRCMKLCTLRLQKKPPQPCPTPPETCEVTVPGGTTIGVCLINGCKGKSTTGIDGKDGPVGDAKGMMDALKGIMDKLMQAMKGGGGGGGSPPPPPPTQPGQQGCTQFYQVSTPSADPCAQYTPPTSPSLFGQNQLGAQTNSASDLLSAIAGGSGVSDQLLTGSDSGTAGVGTESEVEEDFSFYEEPAPGVSEQLLSGALGGSGSGTTEGTTDTSTDTAAATGTLAQRAKNLKAETRGDIEVTGSSVTFVAQTKDPSANTEVAGFYGGDAFGSQPQGIIANVCRKRPWDGSLVSYVIPPSFFDSLCAWRGYEVGELPPPPPPPPQSPPPSPSSADSATSTPTPAPPPGRYVAPELDIWAVPPKVPLGTRTSVFWSTKGVTTCEVTSSDGNFNESSLSGGAATVPLTGETTFSILCDTPAGEQVTDSVTVGISI